MGTIIPFVPLAKSFVKYLPKIADRPYSPIEAAFCLMVDYDDENDVTISGYAKLWKWNKKTVSKFITDHGAKIVYPKDTQKFKNQRGLISILKRDLKVTKKGLITFIDNKDLASNRDLKGTKEGLKRDKSLPSTIEPKPEPDENIVWVVEYLNKICGTNYQSNGKKTISLIKARINDGFNGKDFKIVIDKKSNQWKGTKDEMYLRPETLFGTKFEGYLNQKINTENQEDDGKSKSQKRIQETKEKYGL